MPSSILAGMAVTSHNTGALSTATFDTVAALGDHAQRLLDRRQPASLSIAQGASGGTGISTAVISAAPRRSPSRSAAPRAA